MLNPSNPPPQSHPTRCVTCPSLAHAPAICTKYGLAIGASFAPLVRGLVILMYPIAKPMAMVSAAVLAQLTTSSSTICLARTTTA